MQPVNVRHECVDEFIYHESLRKIVNKLESHSLKYRTVPRKNAPLLRRLKACQHLKIPTKCTFKYSPAKKGLLADSPRVGIPDTKPEGWCTRWRCTGGEQTQPSAVSHRKVIATVSRTVLTSGEHPSTVSTLGKLAKTRPLTSPSRPG